MTKTTIFTERIALDEAQIDPEARVIKNVVLIRAGMSKNKRNYPESVLQAAVSVFEGTKAYDSHIGGARKVAETTGWYKNVRYEEGALRADRYFTRTQAGNDVYAVVEDILSGRAPASLAGLSINAVGQAKTVKNTDGETLEVESITAANSVDDVDNPAAGGTYLAASDSDAMLSAVLNTMTFEEFFQARPEFIERIQKEMKAVRQDDVVKAAKAEADHNRDALIEANNTIQRLEADLEAARQETIEVRQGAAIELLLATTSLPEEWKADLREAFSSADPSEWDDILERDVRKAQAAGHNPRVPITGAGQRVREELPVQTRRAPRYSEVRSPEEHAAYMRSLQENHS